MVSNPARKHIEEKEILFSNIEGHLACVGEEVFHRMEEWELFSEGEEIAVHILSDVLLSSDAGGRVVAVGYVSSDGPKNKGRTGTRKSYK